MNKENEVFTSLPSRWRGHLINRMEYLEKSDEGQRVRIPIHNVQRSGFIQDRECSSILGNALDLRVGGSSEAPTIMAQVVCSLCSFSTTVDVETWPI